MKTSKAQYRGRWHGLHCYFGFHHDLHAADNDTAIGSRCDVADLAAMLRLAGVEFVQTDSKGHPGYATWRSETPGASLAVGMQGDPLAQWRAATRALGIPLHAHYSGIWDSAAGAKHPDWRLLMADGEPAGPVYTIPGWSPAPGALMCPRGPYLEQLLIPQLIEMIDRYEVDGFWVDGDIWAMQPCYCPRCRHAYTAATGETDPPTEASDPRWRAWWQFNLRAFEAYVTCYCDAVHQHKPGVLVCSNWLQTFLYPGQPTVPTDWISGDNTPVWGLDGCRCQARYISTRGKPWDMMLWDFYASHGLTEPYSPWVTKPVQMLQQEAAVVIALGGQVQACDAPWTPCGLRTGQHVPWRMRRVREMGRFVKARRAICQGTETISQVAVLHSEHHAHATVAGPGLAVDTAPVQGAVFAVLENHYGVDVLDEWALLPRLAEFPVVVAPEQHAMSDEMVQALKAYVTAGGRLLLTGADAFDRFGKDFLGVTAGVVTEPATYHVPAADGATPIHSASWRLLEPAGAQALFALGTTPLLEEYLLPHPGATVHRSGKGRVLYVPADLFRDFSTNRYALNRALVGELLRALAGRLDIAVAAPVCVDVVLRRKGGRRFIHLINRASGIPNQPNNGAVDEIPRVGPITIRMRLGAKPRGVSLAFSREKPDWRYVPGRRGGTLTIRVSRVHIHCAVVVADV
ncbi:alpha-L-fucosidase [bacterium]|nr:alpha-L-fucosidase [bacterium]